MLKVKGLFLVIMTFFCVLTTSQVQAKDIGVHVINEGQATDGYKLKLEIRNVNDPIYEHEIDLNIPASSSKDFHVTAALENHLPNGVAASNTIAHLLKDGKVLATSHYAHSYNLNQFAGFQVKINIHEITPHNVNNKAISIVTTSDGAGMLPLHQ